jgi:hypothetical protein
MNSLTTEDALHTSDDLDMVVVDRFDSVINGDHPFVDSRYLIFDTGHSTVDANYSIIDTGHLLINGFHRIPDSLHSLINSMHHLQILHSHHLSFFLCQLVQPLSASSIYCKYMNRG